MVKLILEMKHIALIIIVLMAAGLRLSAQEQLAEQ